MLTLLHVHFGLPEDYLLMLISSSLSLGQPVKGTAKVKAEVRLPLGDRDPNVKYEWPVVQKETRYVSSLKFMPHPKTADFSTEVGS